MRFHRHRARSVYSNQSTFSSTQLVNSLIPQIQHTSKRKSERNTKARAILSRSFSRTSIPPRKGQRNWAVEVSPAEWDADQSRWKYRILVQRRQLQSEIAHSNGDIAMASSFTTAFTWRSLADFSWLEDALRAEYHGALMLPLLSIAIGTPDLANTQYEVDAGLLRDWLGDVLNGIRGQGELVLEQTSVDMMSSEAIEAFLYRNTTPLPIITSAKHMDGALTAVSTLDLPWKDSPEKETRDASFVSSLWSKPFNNCTPFDSLCAAGVPIPADDRVQEKSRMRQIPMDLMRANCTSRALGDTTSLQIQDSFVQYEPGGMDSSNLAIHSHLMEAESELVESHRRACLSAMERLRLLKEEESLVTGAWKRFAISLSNLYSYEKEVENSRVGDKENKDNMPYRKLNKATVDELLRVLARQKQDRSVSSLAVIDAMLRAYVGDLTAVGPSVKAYSEAVSQLSHLEDVPPQTCFSSRQDEPSWQGTIKALFGFVELKKGGSSVQTMATASSYSAEGEAVSKKKAFESRVLNNERLLRQSLTLLCRATPIRSARMAHKYFNAEVTQATLLSSSAISLRTKVNVADRDILEKIRKRHDKETNIDDKTEITIVNRLVDIGTSKKYDSNAVDEAEEIAKSERREKALRLAHEGLGRWDAQLALAIMEAVGIDDPNIQVEETTRDLRLVRRHAIGLRENLSRCLDAVTILRSSILFGHHDGLDCPPTSSTQSIKEARREFFNRCAAVFSGTMVESTKKNQPKSASPSTSILSSADIPMEDTAGWLSVPNKASMKPRARCGAVTLAYFDARDSDAEEFLNKLDRQLKDYKTRVESIESYVYMQCVGIQLEKHFSKKRAEALTGEIILICNLSLCVFKCVKKSNTIVLAFEKKTDIQTAINIAQRKRLPLLVQELRAKLDAVAPGVTHTTVKESKEAHLLSKTLKGEIGELALRRFQRMKESAMDRIVSLMSLWANCKFLCISTPHEVSVV